MKIPRSLSHFFASRIYVILRGGLGNQLHQIAAACALGQGQDIKIKIFPHIVDNALDSTRKGYFRYFSLAEVFPQTYISETNWLESLILRVLLRGKFTFLTVRSINESNFHLFDCRIKIQFLKGWFQSHDFLPEHFNPKKLVPLPSYLTKTTNIHIRLTDFIKIDRDPLGAKYYKAAILKSKKIDSDCFIQCYSDDINAARELLKFLPGIYFPETKNRLEPHELLLALSDCSILICSRSSLCWWAAQIVQARGGKVISCWVGSSQNKYWEQIAI